jgi:hypothetical protein
MTHDKPQDISVRSAPEAVKKLLIVIHIERGCFLAVKRTTSFEFTSRARQFDPPPNDLGQGQAVAQILKKTRRNGHGLVLHEPAGKGEAFLSDAPTFIIFWTANGGFLRFRFSNTSLVFCDTVLENSPFSPQNILNVTAS